MFRLAQKTEAKPGWVKMAREGYAELVNAIIRPPRAKYVVEELGPRQLLVGELAVQRTDLEIKSHRATVSRSAKMKGPTQIEATLKCSHWEPAGICRPAQALPCVVYLHGNCGCRMEALDVLSLTMSQGMSLFAFDFGGAGLSDGEYISLGFWEREDLASVIEHLRKDSTVSSIALWGRSMGAVTALLYASRCALPLPPACVVEGTGNTR